MLGHAEILVVRCRPEGGEPHRLHAPGQRPGDRRLGGASGRDRRPRARDRGVRTRSWRGSSPSRALLLTHIHLDHAGAAGVLAGRFPELQVYVHEVGARTRSTRRAWQRAPSALRGRDGAPVGRDRPGAGGSAHRAPRRRGGRGLDVHYAPGHARHHVVYFDRADGSAYTGDVAGCRVPPSELVAAPTPPPEIEVEVWRESLAMLRRLAPSRVCMTHFGSDEDVAGHLDKLEAWLTEAATESETGDEQAFASWLTARFDAEGPRSASACARRCRPDQLWLGLERYWRSAARRPSGRRVSETAASGGFACLSL